jgi:hypothetical protein
MGGKTLRPVNVAPKARDLHLIFNMVKPYASFPLALACLLLTPAKVPRAVALESVGSPIPAAELRYPATGPGHSISNVWEYGRTIILEDGSVWEIAGSDQVQPVLWLPFSHIGVIEQKEPYLYVIVNFDTMETVDARYLGGRQPSADDVP